MKIQITVDSELARKKLAQMAKNSVNLRPALQDIENMLQSSVEQNFVDEGRPKAWKGLSESRKKQREKRKPKPTWPGQILTETGQLRGSINTRIQEKNVLIGSNLEYAKKHQDGDQSKNLPARPFLVIQKEDVIEAREILLEHLLKGVNQ